MEPKLAEKMNNANRADKPKVTIKHHEVIGASKEPGNISPHIELSIKLVNNHMDIHKLAHIRIRVVHVVQFGQILVPQLVIADMNRDRDGTLVVGNQFGEDWVPVKGNQGGDGDGFWVELADGLEVVREDF